MAAFFRLLILLPLPWLGVSPQSTTCSANNLTVDLGYGIYKGESLPGGRNAWFGVRYAAPPTGTNRWKLPATPTTARTSATPNKLPGLLSCPQAGKAPYIGDNCPSNLKNLTTLPNNCGSSFGYRSEDCLIVNIVSPSDAVNLPVLVYIHGGGYGVGNAHETVGPLMTANNNSFVVVTIQYRLNAFGFLSSADLYKRGGVLNVGLQDQLFALEWVQKYICNFGGDASQVTIAGQSAGAGSVMHQTLAKNGTLGNTNFRYAIAHSPYLPPQYNYNDPVPKGFYDAFVNEVGCTGASPLICLRKKNTKILQLAAQRISASGLYGTWAFVPVVDPDFVSQQPSEQLYSTTPLNGEAILTNSNANEGTIFTAQNVSSYSDFQAYVQRAFPRVNYTQLLANYQVGNTSDNSNGILFATNGLSPPTALNQSSVGTGQQQRVNNLYSESTFVCPSYWLADGFSSRSGKSAYKSEYSVPVALHGDDLSTYFSSSLPYVSPQYIQAVCQMWGNFVLTGNPSIPNVVANGNSSDGSSNPASNWPLWTQTSRQMINLNQTGGTATTTAITVPAPTGQSATHITGIPYDTDPGLENSFTSVDAYTFEGGRGARCDFWRTNGLLVPE